MSIHFRVIITVPVIMDLAQQIRILTITPTREWLLFFFLELFSSRHLVE